MSETTKYLKRMMENRVSELHTALLGEITSINGNTASVKPIQGSFPLLVGLPMVKHRYEYTDTLDSDTGTGNTETREAVGPIYEVGDIVLVVFLERARDGAGDRKHDLSDGVIIGVIA